MRTVKEGVVSVSMPERCGDGDEGNPTAEDISRVDVHETNSVQILNVINEGIRSPKEVDYLSYGVARPSTLLSLSLHSNRISSLEGLASMTALTALNLSSNELDGATIRSCAPQLGALSCLKSLDLSCNKIDALLGLPFLPRLSRLLVPYNRLASLDGVQALASSLTFLDARDNRIAGSMGDHAPHLASLGRLRSLLLMSPGGGQRNPVCSCPGYREGVLSAASWLQTLDATPACSLGIAPDSPAHVKRAPRRDAASGGRAARSGNDRPRSGSGGADRAVDAERVRGRDDTVGAAPEEVVPTPRIDAVAGRFLRRRGRGQPKRDSRWRRLRDEGRGVGDSLAEHSDGDGSPGASASWASADGRLAGDDGWSEGEYGVDCPGVGPAVHPEKSVGRRVVGAGRDNETRARVWRERGEGVVDDDEELSGHGQGSGEDVVAEEQRLLNRLRSVAQEARLEVMDSRLHDLHETQARDSAEARRAIAAAEAAAMAAAMATKAATTAAVAARRPDVGTTGRLQQQERDRRSLSQVGSSGGGGGNPRAQGAFGRGASRGRGGVGSKRAPRVYDPESRRRRLRDTASETLPRSGMTPALDGDVDLSRNAAVDASPLRRGLEDRAVSCPRCCSSGEPGLAPDVDGAVRCLAAGAGEDLAGATWRSDPRSPENSATASSISNSSNRASQGMATSFPARATGVVRHRRSGVLASPARGAAAEASAVVGGSSMGGVVAAAAVMGAAAAALAGVTRRRSAMCFLRWARHTESTRAEAALAAAEAALAEARADAGRERLAWESLEKSLEASAATREREARETAEEEWRERVRKAQAACRSAEEAAAGLRRKLAQAEADAASAVDREEQAQVARQHAQVDAARFKAELEAATAALGARAERLEEQLRGKARGEEEAEEECRRVRALLREVESRCRGLEDQVEESRAREKRVSEGAEDARKRVEAEAEKKVAIAVEAERELVLVLKRKLKETEAAARGSTAALREAEERQARGRRAVEELAQLARHQKAALQVIRAEAGAARAERDEARRAAAEASEKASRLATEIQEQRKIRGARDEELAVLRRSLRQEEKRLQAEKDRAEALEKDTKEFEANLEASTRAQGDLRAALMVKDKVLEDREKLVKELRDREEDALSEARAWRDRLDAHQSEADLQLDAARDEISELQAQVVELSGVEDQLRDVFKELRRYRKREAEGGHEDDREGVHSRGKGAGGKEDAEGLTAVAAVTAAAKAVEEELREQLEAKDEALRYVENELLGMKSLFEGKEASLRQELGSERNKLAREAAEWKRRAEEAATGRAAAEDAAREQASKMADLRSSLWTGECRTKELEQTLRALLNKYEQERRSTLKLSKIAALFNDLHKEEGKEAEENRPFVPRVPLRGAHGLPSQPLEGVREGSGGDGGGPC